MISEIFRENEHWTGYGRVRYLNEHYSRKREHTNLLNNEFLFYRNPIMQISYMFSFSIGSKVLKCENFGGELKMVLRKWNKNKVVKELRYIFNIIRRVPTRDYLRKIGRFDLERAAQRYFGNWNEALKATNLKYNKKTDWTRKESILELKEIALRLGHSPSMGELKAFKRYDLLNAGLKFFGKYNVFLREAKLNIVLEMNKWSKSKIIEEMQLIYCGLGRTPRRSELASIKRYDLINAAETYFPSWSDAIIASGFLPNPDALDNDRTWRDWEELVFSILSKKEIKFEKKKYIKGVGYPDVHILSNNTIIEIKLNCSDNSVKSDIKKYLPHCKKLEIWYLMGKPFGILSNKVKFVGPNKIRQMIQYDKRLLDRYNTIKKGVNELWKK